MTDDIENGLKLCKMILLYEPNNSRALNFLPVLEEKLAQAVYIIILVLPYIINWFFVACRISSLEGACEIDMTNIIQLLYLRVLCLAVTKKMIQYKQIILQHLQVEIIMQLGSTKSTRLNSCMNKTALL
ncbi:hypothetical protein EB796_020793 [Bugula neritina]|uniref:Uncharacterized protein n=1 Tax=Bugula neritina TaxID=10212 RepID=A0A7J7J612_BUGNE|nr:hypothetical protein EB796_020793 [Bugula neritina]